MYQHNLFTVTNSPSVPLCKRKTGANILMLGTVMPAPADAGLNIVNKG